VELLVIAAAEDGLAGGFMARGGLQQPEQHERLALIQAEQVFLLVQRFPSIDALWGSI
jgi:hypothetical protein